MTRSCQPQPGPEVVDGGAETDEIIVDELLGDVGDHQGDPGDGELRGQRDVAPPTAGLVDLVADHLTAAADEQDQVDDVAQADPSLGQDVVAQYVAPGGGVGDIVGRVLRGDEARLVGHHHRMLPDRVDG